MKRYIDCTTDAECQAMLADLTALAARAKALSLRLDREHVAAGKAWGITRGLDQALHAAQSEFAAEEISDDAGRIVSNGPWNGMTPAEVLADRDAFNRACGE